MQNGINNNRFFLHTQITESLTDAVESEEESNTGPSTSNINEDFSVTLDRNKDDNPYVSYYDFSSSDSDYDLEGMEYEVEYLESSIYSTTLFRS